jgi:hypothetical protein
LLLGRQEHSPGFPPSPGTRGRTPLILSIPRLCSLAEPTGPAQLSRAYLYIVSPGRGVFQHPASTWQPRRLRWQDHGVFQQPVGGRVGKAGPVDDRWGEIQGREPGAFDTWRGSLIVNVAPLPSSLSTPIVPLCRSTIPYTVERPSPTPLPSFLVV